MCSMSGILNKDYTSWENSPFMKDCGSMWALYNYWMVLEMGDIRWERQCKKEVDTRFPDLFVTESQRSGWNGIDEKGKGEVRLIFFFLIMIRNTNEWVNSIIVRPLESLQITSFFLSVQFFQDFWYCGDWWFATSGYLKFRGTSDFGEDRAAWRLA